MFMQDCPPELDATLARIQARELVMRNLFAFAAGIEKTLYWQFLHAHGDRNDLMTLMFGKIGMVAEENGALTRRSPVAEAYARMAAAFRGLERVTQIDTPGQPEIFLFRVDRGQRGSLYVVWQKGDLFSGEDAPPVLFRLKWSANTVSAIDALGKTVQAQLLGGEVHVPISVTPVYLDL